MPILLTPEVIGSYPNVFKAVLRKDAKPTDKPKFGITSLFTHDALKSAEYNVLLKAMIDECTAKWGAAAFKQLMEEQQFDSPFRKDIRTKGYDHERFACYISSESGEEYPPGVFDNSRRGADGKPLPITDRREIYPGVRLLVSVSPRAYGGPGTKWKAGLKFDLRNVLKMGDGPRIAGGAGADGSEFAGIAPPPAPTTDDAAALAALMS